MRMLEWLRKIIGWDKSVQDCECADLSLFTVCGDGLNRWGIIDGDDIEVEMFNDVGDCYEIEGRCVVIDKNCKMKMFIDYFDLHPESAEKMVEEYKRVKAERNPNIFVGELSVNDLYGWEKYYAVHYREFADMSRGLWNRLCQNAEKKIIGYGEWREVNYHKMAVLALKYGNNATTYEIVPSEFIIGKQKK